MRLKLASRKSDLARLQLQTVGKYLEEKLQAETEYIYSESFGDKNLDIDLAGSENKGLFTKDFYDAIVNKEVDMVVHSWKDLPIEDNETTIAMTLPRHDARDLLLVKKASIEKIKKTGIIDVMTSSPRREFFIDAHLNKIYPAQLNEIKFTTIRGNIPTRLGKLLKGDSDALVMAKAAVDRMLSAPGEEFAQVSKEIQAGIEQCEWMVLPLSLFPSSAAQGALAVEVLKGSEIEAKLRSINFESDFETVKLEREKLKELGGGCHSKLGVNYLPRDYGQIYYLSREVKGDIKNESALLRIKKLNKTTKNLIWPGERSIPAERVKVDVSESVLAGPGGLYISKLSALPDSYKPPIEQKIWTSGLITWEKLADRGVWVHGSSESLGEKEPMRLNELLGNNFKWAKLTHKQGAVSGKDLIATYEVKWNFKPEDLKGMQHFYWMSGEMYKQAVKVCPEIKNETHYCGPGHTYEVLQKEVNPDKLFVCLGYEAWKKEII